MSFASKLTSILMILVARKIVPTIRCIQLNWNLGMVSSNLLGKSLKLGKIYKSGMFTLKAFLMAQMTLKRC